MAIARVNASTVLSTTSNASSYTSSGYTPASNSNVLVIMLHGYKSTGSDNLATLPPTVTWGGVAQNITVLTQTTAQRPWEALVVVTNPGTTSQTVGVTYDASHGGGRAQAIDIVEYSGVDTASPSTSTQAGSGNASARALSFTTSDNGAMLSMGVSVESDRTPFTPDAGTTEISEGATGTTSFNDCSYTATEKLVPTAGATTIGTSWASSGNSSSAGVELKPSGVAPAVGAFPYPNRSMRTHLRR